MPRKILIVDDVKSNRLILREILKEDHHILEAAGGREALDILHREYASISAVLLDISMPDMDGFEVLSRIREDVQLAQIPVIMITGSEGEQTRILSLANGANDYITKPYRSEVVKHCLRNQIAYHEAAETVATLQRDKLTRLYTRETFFEKVRELVSEREPGYYVMACFDVDKFKVINDQYGTETGDMVLRNLAQLFRSGFTKEGGICSRIAADNFAILYPRSFMDTPELAAIREGSLRIEGLVTPISYSIGRYIVDDPSMSPAGMYDRAMLAAASVKGRFDTKIAIYDDSMREHLLREQEIVSDMEQALRGDEFEAWFQPQYNHVTGALVGAEALARWRHPQKGLIPPGDFIPVFEKNGFVYELDKYIWEDVCRKLRKWRDEGRNPLPVSVNISRYDLMRPELAEIITGLVEKYELPRDLLRLEITESAFSESTQSIVRVVRELIDLGFTVEIDDFGSGYSSLNTLKDVPAQILKLDMKFFERGDDASRGGNIIESVVRMAKWLGMSVIAEGVETIEQADYLRSIGCSYIQGYLYARPMPFDKYEEHCRGASKEERLLKLETVENLDNNAFWDPKSMDTLIFNSYVGGACIYEYHAGKIELLRATEKYAQVIGSAGMTVEDALRLDWTKYLDEDSGRRVARDLEESVATKREVTGEYVYIDLPGCPHETYLRSTLRVIAAAGERYLVYCMNENVTAQRKAEREARESAEQIRMMMNDTPGGFVRMRLKEDGKLSTEYVNETFCHMRGMSAEEILSQDAEDALVAIHPGDAEPALRAMREVLTSGKKGHTIYRLRRGDGSYTPFNAYGSVTKNESGQTYINIFYTELSEAEKKEYTMRDIMPVILSAIMESSENLDFAKDKDFNYICCSPAFAKFTRQKSVADVIGKSDYDLWTKEEADHFRADDLRLFEGGDSLVNYTEPIPSDDDVQHYSITSKYILRDSAGEIIGLYGSGRDITDTRAALDRLQLLTDSIPGGIATYAVSPDYIKITYFNDGFCKLLGFQREEYLKFAADNGVISLISQEGQAEIDRQLRELLRTGEPIDCTYRCSKYDGSGEIWINLRGTLGERCGDMAFVNTVLYDVTAQREAEEKERKTAEMMSTIMDNVRGGISAVTLSEDGKVHFAFANARFYEILGYTREQFEAEVGNVVDLVFREDVKEILAAMDRVLTTRKPEFYKYRATKRDGSTLYLRCNAACASISGVGSEVLLSVITDITAESTEKERQKQLLDNMPYGAALYSYEDGEFSVIHLNRKYWELVERESADYGELSILDSLHPDDRDRFLHELQSAIREERGVSVNLRVLYRKGEYRLFHITANLQSAENGYLIYAAYDPVDPEALSYQQALPLLLSAVMESSNDFAFAKDRDFRYLCASPAFLRLAGVESERDIVGKTDYDLFPAEMAEQFRNNDLALMQSERSLVDFDEVIHTPDGKQRYCRASKYPLRDANGRTIGLYGVSRDVTREHGALEQLQLINDAVPGGIATYSVRDGVIRITYCNEGFCRLFGGTLEGFKARGDFDPVEWLVEEDGEDLRRRITELAENGTPVDQIYRVRTVDGRIKWINQKASFAARQGDTVFFNSLLLDVTERQIAEEALRISEEEKNLALRHSGNLVCRYDVAARTLTMADATAAERGLPTVLTDVPFEPVRQGLISPETADAYTGFFEAILKGNKAGTVLFQQRYLGDWRWEEAKSSTVFSDDGTPVKAVISMSDATDKVEKETIYKKWQQSLADKPTDSFTLFRTNINRHSDYDTREGSLLTFDFERSGPDSGEVSRAYAEKCIFPEDRDRYVAFVNADTMLASYYRGKRSDFLEYRQLTADGGTRWLRLSVDLVECPNSTDVEAYMLYEDIDEQKRSELQTKELSETDPLTGLLNRKTFSEMVDRILRDSKPDDVHALLMLDIDGFKLVNDVFGHMAGDQALIEIADDLRSITRTGDLVARLGGDEFVVFLRGAANDAAAVAKAKKIRSFARRSFSLEVEISVSIGIAFAPRDGTDFDTLYKKADSALYYVKGSGKNNEVVYRDYMEGQHLRPEADTYKADGTSLAEKKRRMLIVDDSSIDNLMLENIFKDEFIVEKAQDGNSALIRLRHYGGAVSVVLLDLMMPGMDGFAVLDKMRESETLRSVPVIIVSGDESRDACLAAIRRGATDFVTKPVDPDLLRVRVRSAVSHAENERLRAKNAMLELESRELTRFEAYLDAPGITFIEYEWRRGEFNYFPSISKYLLGNYNDRPFWQILLSDMVADTRTVQDMQDLVHRIAQNTIENGAIRLVRLKTPQKETHTFRMDVRRSPRGGKLGGSVIISLTDLEYASPK